MSEDDRTTDMGEQRIAERIAAWYAAPLEMDYEGAQRVVAEALRRDALSDPRRRGRMSRAVWLMGACAAAVILAVIVGRVRAVARVGATPVSVRFVLRGMPTATRVALVGDFNGWNVGATPLDRASSGVGWTVDVRIRPGRYGYAFVVDGQQWIADPTAPLAPDAFGDPTSVIIVSAGGAT